MNLNLRRYQVIATTIVVLTSSPVLSQTLATHRIPAALAMEAVTEAVSTCAKQGHWVSATVINPDGVRIAMLHGDRSGLHTIDASYAKAYAAVSFAPIFNLETSGALAEMSQQPGFQVPAGMLMRAGGVVIKLGDEVIGAIGVGGAPGANLDEVCARAGIEKIRSRIK